MGRTLSGRFIVYRTTAVTGRDEFRWRLVAPNARILASGEGFTTKRKCINSISALVKYAAGAPITFE